jgi:alpha-tubulin suppressor-like RCC1 family protein
MGRRRKHVKPPEKWYFEKTVKDTDFGDELYHRSEEDSDVVEAGAAPLYPLSWGWADSGRAGNITEELMDEPRRVQQTRDGRYIACAAGKHHSLLVSEQGNVFSFGSNSHGQLGHGHSFTSNEAVQEPVQYYPMQVTPTGHLRYGRDLKAAEVSCGATFSVAREACPADAVRFSKGMLQLERALLKLAKLFPDALPIQMAVVKLRQERYMFSRAYGGQLMAFGTGLQGELGLGRFLTVSTFPRVIPSLRAVQITQIASGNQHTLAIDAEGRLYSWGCGKSGQLGHENGDNYFEPTLIKFFDQYYVEQCAAGRQHSAVLMTSRKSSGDRDSKMKRLTTFGRGAHGRLGLGHNKSLAKPTLVSVWPPSVRSMSLVQVACGGAHTVVLATKGVPRTLARPIGVETVVLAFGFGRSGQLGTGYIDDHEFYPVKAKFPRWEIISEISAGKSWSMARTVSGEVFGWGKGMRGQLGLKKKCMSVAPRNLCSFASVLKLASGYAHNLCIATPKKYHNSKIVQKVMPDLLSQEAFIYNRSLLQQNKACDMATLCLAAGGETRVLGTVGCCRVDCPQTTCAGRLQLQQQQSLALCARQGYEAGRAGREREGRRVQDLLARKKMASSRSPPGGKHKDSKEHKDKHELHKPKGKAGRGRGRQAQQKPPEEEEGAQLPTLLAQGGVAEGSYVRVHPSMRYMQCLDCRLTSACMLCIRVCHRYALCNM